jgi:hypothetical protein
MRTLVTLALLLAAHCEAGALRKNHEGFEVVGGGATYESFASEDFHRTLFTEEEEFVAEEAGAEKLRVSDESLELVSIWFLIHCAEPCIV